MSNKPERPKLTVVPGGRSDDKSGKQGKQGKQGKPRGLVDVDASFVGEQVIHAEARPAPKALGPARGPALPDAVPKDMPEEPGRRLAPGAPLSPGTVPLELALHLRSGEALVWWDAKASHDLRPILIALGGCLLVLLAVTLISPSFWSQPWSDLWPPVAALLSPVALMLLREHLGQRSLMVTDTSIVEVSRTGQVSRLVFSAVRRVQRDLLTGGVLLQGKDTKIRVPPALSENARAAIASQRRSVLRGDANPPDDPLGWMPGARNNN
ncbi:MAG: hypothetical protein H0T76_25080 [Nannocystis sp.]|nr:hypothetical protein [Nannocystis sp.]MBA3549767.1 hypothetical protein [Nannocystis sp.]